MAPSFDTEDSDSLGAKIENNATTLFRVRKDKPQLQATKCCKKIEDGREFICVERNKNVTDISALKALEHNSKNSKQFFVIRQQHTYTTLDISRELFADLICTYRVFSHIWKVMFTFGRKSVQNEFVFPDIRARRSFAPEGESGDVYESVCVFRRVELHDRGLEEKQSPWSIRQTGVYHKLRIATDFQDQRDSKQQSNSMFIFIAPSKALEEQISGKLDLSVSDDVEIEPWNIYRLLIGDSLCGFPDYMVWLEDCLKEHSKSIIYAKVGEEKEKLSPLTDLNINFVDRQDLMILEDYIIDLQVILTSMLGNIIGIRDQCRKWCNIIHGESSHECPESRILEEYDEYVKEVKGFIRRAGALKERAKSIAQLLSDLLSYEDAIQLKNVVEQSKDVAERSREIAVQTKDVADQSRLENQSMLYLTERSTRDAAAVKILTVIGLIYLPSTIVSNFFSTQFAHIDDNGNLIISPNVWILAACVVPLTVITIAIWWACIRCTYVKHPNRAAPVHRKKILLHSSSSFRSWVSSKRGLRSPDLECGTIAAGTWSSDATTAIAGGRKSHE